MEQMGLLQRYDELIQKQKKGQGDESDDSNDFKSSKITKHNIMINEMR